jgi:predicted nucleic acid-binding Zn finger protein
MDKLTLAMNIFNGYYIDDEGWKHYRVQGKTYDIKMHPMTLEWECSCPAYKFKKGTKTCKHIKEIQTR